MFSKFFSFQSIQPVSAQIGVRHVHVQKDLEHAYQQIADIYRPQRSWGKVIFSEACVKNSVHRGGDLQATPRGEVEGSGLGGGSPGPHPGGSLRGLAWGVSRPIPGGRLRGLAWGGVSQHALRQTPPSRWLLLRAVRILLECILVTECIH